MNILAEVQQVIDFAKQYQIFAGFIGAGAVGTVLVLLRKIPHTLIRWFKYYFTIEMVSYSDHVYFDWLDCWLADQKFAKKSRNVILIDQSYRD